VYIKLLLVLDEVFHAIIMANVLIINTIALDDKGSDAWPGSVSCKLCFAVNGQDREVRPKWRNQNSWTSFGENRFGPDMFVAGAGFVLDERMGMRGNRRYGFWMTKVFKTDWAQNQILDLVSELASFIALV